MFGIRFKQREINANWAPRVYFDQEFNTFHIGGIPFDGIGTLNFDPNSSTEGLRPRLGASTPGLDERPFAIRNAIFKDGVGGFISHWYQWMPTNIIIGNKDQLVPGSWIEIFKHGTQGGGIYVEDTIGTFSHKLVGTNGSWDTTLGLQANGNYTYALSGLNNIVISNSSYGGIVGGRNNTQSGVIGGSILGGDNNINNASYGGVIGGRNNTQSGNHGFIGCGRDNTQSGNHGFIGGGQFNTNDGVTSGAILGGENNLQTGSRGFIGTGDNNTQSGSFGFIGSGANNSQSGGYGFIGAGSSNIQSGSHGFIGAGSNCSISTTGGGILTSRKATVNNVYGHSHSSGAFTTPGDSQSERIIMRAESAGTIVQLEIDSSILSIKVQNNTLYAVRAKITGMNKTIVTDAIYADMNFLVRVNSVGIVTKIGTEDISVYANVPGTYGILPPVMNPDTVINTVGIKCTNPSGGYTHRWTAEVQLLNVGSL